MTDQLSEIKRLQLICSNLLREATVILAEIEDLKNVADATPLQPTVHTKLLAAAKAYVSITDDPVTYHYKPRYDPRCGCGECSVRTYERLLAAIADAEKK